MPERKPLPYNPEISVLGTYPRKTCLCVRKNTCPRTSTRSPFITEHTRPQAHRLECAHGGEHTAWEAAPRPHVTTRAAPRPHVTTRVTPGAQQSQRRDRFSRLTVPTRAELPRGQNAGGDRPWRVTTEPWQGAGDVVLPEAGVGRHGGLREPVLASRHCHVFFSTVTRHPRKALLENSAENPCCQ